MIEVITGDTVLLELVLAEVNQIQTGKLANIIPDCTVKKV